MQSVIKGRGYRTGSGSDRIQPSNSVGRLSTRAFVAAVERPVESFITHVERLTRSLPLPVL